MQLSIGALPVTAVRAMRRAAICVILALVAISAPFMCGTSSKANTTSHRGDNVIDEINKIVIAENISRRPSRECENTVRAIKNRLLMLKSSIDVGIMRGDRASMCSNSESVLNELSRQLDVEIRCRYPSENIEFLKNSIMNVKDKVTVVCRSVVE